MSGLAFTKMHGLGNDFVVLDGRGAPLALDPAQARAIADRRTGVGCDQLITILPPRMDGADAFMLILNADGDEVEACGNGARCVASILMGEAGAECTVIETVVGLLPTERGSNGAIAVDMGEARLGWREIPLAAAADTLALDVTVGPLSAPCAVNMGNPHAVFFVDDVEAVDLETHGPAVEHHPMFPERTNVEVIEALSATRLRMRVWERGVGITRACGSGACAALVAAHRRGITGRQAEVVLDGGSLEIAWLENGHVRMAGPAAVSFTGALDPALLG
jgi:diaminopimelate epimerase